MECLSFSDHTVMLNGKEILLSSRPDANHVSLEGDGKSIRLRQIDASKFLLLSRGFYWINEIPFNR